MANVNVDADALGVLLDSVDLWDSPETVHEAAQLLRVALEPKYEKYDLSDIELVVVNYITETWNEFGYSPTMRDIKDLIEVSLSTVHKIIVSLEDKGILYRDRLKSRTMRVIP